MTEVLGLIFILFIDISCINPDCRVSSMASFVLAPFVFILLRRLAKRVLVSTSAWSRVLAELDLLWVSVLGEIVFFKGLIIFEAPSIDFLHS